MRLQDHLKLFLADFLVQLLGYQREGLIYGVLSLDTRQRNILRERRKMTVKLWYSVLNHYHWTCAGCGLTNYRNQNRFKHKLEVDHITALYCFGKTEWANLQALCKPCNRKKGVS